MWLLYLYTWSRPPVDHSWLFLAPGRFDKIQEGTPFEYFWGNNLASLNHRGVHVFWPSPSVPGETAPFTSVKWTEPAVVGLGPATQVREESIGAVRNYYVEIQTEPWKYVWGQKLKQSFYWEYYLILKHFLILLTLHVYHFNIFHSNNM